MVVKRKPDQTQRAGQQTLGLAEKDKAKLEPRLRAGTLGGLKEDLPLLGDTVDGQKTAGVVKKSATRSQGDLAAKLATRLQALRDVAHLTGLPRDVQLAMGVGKALRPGVVRSVTSGADAMINAYAVHTDAMRAAGVLPADLEEIAALRLSLLSADELQEDRKLTAKEKTALRNQVQARVEEAIKLIVAAATLALADDPERLAMYRAQLPASKAGAKPVAKRPSPVAPPASPGV